MKQDRLLAFVANELQLAALAVLVLAYALKVRQIVKLPMPADTAPPRGSAVRGVARSFVRSLAPGRMESTSRHRGRWLAFALYHLGILAAIIASFLIPLARWTLSGPVRATVALLVGVAAGAGLLKLWWRTARPELRLVSSPDDIASLIAVEGWFVTAIPAVLTGGRKWLIAFFGITAALLIYVPFSKMSHYVYWLFARVYLGQRFGRRGVL